MLGYCYIADAKEVRDYFNKCVINRGNIGEQPLEPGNQKQTPGKGGDKRDEAPQKNEILPGRLALSREILSAQNGLCAARNKNCQRLGGAVILG